MQTKLDVTEITEPDDEADVCNYCGNAYKVVWFKEGDDYNDFGYRHCPFCGILTGELAHIGSM